MSSPGPSRQQGDLADMVEMLLDKGVVINADIAVSVGDTELLGVQVRAALASFETAAKYGLEFPEGTDTDRLEAAAEGREVDDDPARTQADDDVSGSQRSTSRSVDPAGVAVRPQRSVEDQRGEGDADG